MPPTSPTSVGPTDAAARFGRGSSTMSAAIRRCLVPRCSASGARISAPWSTPVDCRRRGPSSTTRSSPTTPAPNASSTYMARPAPTRRSRRARARIRIRRSATNPAIAEVAERLRAQGLRPFPIPSSVQDHAGGACVRCNTCDGFPCRLGAKGRRRDVPHRPGVAARERRTANGGPCCSPARRCERPAHRGRRAGRRHASPGRSLRTGCGRRQQCCDPASLRPREAPERPRQFVPEWSGATT